MMALLSEIKNTIKYARSFDGKLNLDQLWFRLLSDKIYSKKEIKEKNPNLKFKISKNNENSKKIKLAQELTKNHLSKFSDILMVGITGSVAAENAKEEEDIDLFIICKHDTMWWTRLKLRMYVRLMNIPHRRFLQSEKPNDFCFNLWMEESDLRVPKLKQNQKNAVDLILVKVLFNLNNTFEKFVLENSWVKKYVANGYNKLVTSNKKLVTRKAGTGIIYKCLNYIVFVGQIIYIRLKGPIKFINLRQAFFHK